MKPQLEIVLISVLLGLWGLSTLIVQKYPMPRPEAIIELRMRSQSVTVECQRDSAVAVNPGWKYSNCLKSLEPSISPVEPVPGTGATEPRFTQ